MKNSLNIDDFLFPSWKNFPNELIDIFFLAIQNIVAGTATMSKKMLSENCIEWKIQLSSKSPVILLQYELKDEKNDIVHLIPVTDYQEVDVNVETVDDKNIGHKNFKMYDEIREKTSVLCNFKEELPELLSVLNDKDVIRDKQMSFNSIQQNQTKLLSCEMNNNTTANIIMKSNKSESSSVETRSLGDICVNLPSCSNVPILQVEKRNGNCGDETNNERSEKIVSNNGVMSCDLTYHKRIHTRENPLKSNICKKSFTSTGNLNEHKRNHRKKSLHYCEYCGKSFKFLSNLIAHIRTHTGEKPFKCEICNKCFPNSNYMTVHKRIHTGQKPFSCDICNRSFIDTSSLSTHKRTHSGVKPFKCDVCTKSYTQSSGLIIHRRIHTGEKPFKCDMCTKSFTRSSVLTIHRRIHTGEKPFKCDMCTKSFTRSSSLTIHRRIHTGEKPFKCDICTKAFTNSNSLTVHKKIHK